MLKYCPRFTTERNKEAILLKWFRRYQKESINNLIPVEKFDKEYKKLFSKFPLWYTWNKFYRDHCFVGLRRR